MGKSKMTAVYCRLAYKDDARIEEQKEQVLRYAAEQGYNNITLYVDNGASGNDFNRPAFSKMTSDIAAGKINIVVVKSLDRIGRNAFSLLDALNHSGIVVKALDGSCEDAFCSLNKLIREAISEMNKRRSKIIE